MRNGIMQRRLGALARRGGGRGPGSPWLAHLHDSDFVFVHINKTGGSSVEQALGLPTRHFTAAEAQQAIGAQEWARRFTFAFVRNPWDKVVSHYHYRVKTNQTGLQERGVKFNEWVRLAYGERHPDFYDKPRMFMPQVDWLCDRDGELLVEFIGRFERLAEDFATVCERLGRHAELPHVKGSGRGNYRDYYDEESVAIIRDWFADDVELFDYEF